MHSSDVAHLVNAVLNTVQVVALAYIAARWRTNGRIGG